MDAAKSSALGWFKRVPGQRLWGLEAVKVLLLPEMFLQQASAQISTIITTTNTRLFANYYQISYFIHSQSCTILRR